MKKPKILIVEDQAVNLLLLKKVFQQDAAFEVLCASDGIEGVEIATSKNPEIVLLDINLPGLDGFGVLSEIKERKIETRVIMFSGEHTDIETAVRCIREGACDFFTKGKYSNKELITQV